MIIILSQTTKCLKLCTLEHFRLYVWQNSIKKTISVHKQSYVKPNNVTCYSFNCISNTTEIPEHQKPKIIHMSSKFLFGVPFINIKMAVDYFNGFI